MNNKEKLKEIEDAIVDKEAFCSRAFLNEDEEYKDLNNAYDSLIEVMNDNLETSYSIIERKNEVKQIIFAVEEFFTVEGLKSNKRYNELVAELTVLDTKLVQAYKG